MPEVTMEILIKDREELAQIQFEISQTFGQMAGKSGEEWERLN